MNRNRFAQNASLAALLLLPFAVSGAAHADSPQSRPAQTPSPAQPGPQKLASMDDNFTGLDLSDEQKTEIAKIRQVTEERKAMVVKSATLNQDQKDAMITGYTRLQYSQMFRVLTPTQQKVVRKRIQDQRAETPKQKKAAPGN
jgi:Spy/CpxP family protein refolding chaperone